MSEDASLKVTSVNNNSEKEIENSLSKFATKFWDNYNKGKSSEIIASIPQFLKIKSDARNISSYQRVFVYIILTLPKNNSIDKKCINDIIIKYKMVFKFAGNHINALQYFVCLEYFLQHKNISETINQTMVDDMANSVFLKLQGARNWSITDEKLFKRFIIILVQIESPLNGSRPTFAWAEKAIKYFSSNIVKTNETKNGWPEYLLDTLQALKLAADAENRASELVQKLKNLVKEKIEHRKDIAIMMSLAIDACPSLISTGSLLFIQHFFSILGEAYDIIRDKTISSCDYQLRYTYHSVCCQKVSAHIGLHLLGALRKMFAEAMNQNKFNEILVSQLSNYMVAESVILEGMSCKNSAFLIYDFGETVGVITKNIDKIVNNCSIGRGKRTLQRLLSIKTLSPARYYYLADELAKICEQTNDKMDQITAIGEKLRVCTKKSQGSIIYQIHRVQRELNDPKKFETITAIVTRLPKRLVEVNVDSARMQFLQLSTEIEHSKLTNDCRKKLADEVCKMDFYKGNGCSYINLIKTGVQYLRAMILIDVYKENVEYKNHFEPLNEDFVLLKNESAVIEKMIDCLGYLTQFLQDKDTWSIEEDKDEYILYAEKMLHKIGQCLMSRQYKDYAIRAFRLLYQYAKLSNNQLKQIVAAGHLIENLHLDSTLSEKEIVTVLQSKIIDALKDVNTMSVIDLGNFLFSFLQLAMYTMRYQFNIDHTKKYMQAIHKLLYQHDDNKDSFLGVRLKYSEVMFELIVRDAQTGITPITFIEDILHRFKDTRIKTSTDDCLLPGIMFDLISTLYAFTQPRYEFRYASTLIWIILASTARKGYLFLFAKTKILTSSECLLTDRKRLEDHMSHLDVLFGCKTPTVQKESPAATVTWNEEITTFLHPDNCKCYQCAHKYLSLLNMEVAALKAWAIYSNKNYKKSLQSFQLIYDHWSAMVAASYSVMLLNYSNCLISNRREKKSEVILSEALTACNDSAQAQDIILRLLCYATKNEMPIDQQLQPPYANKSRPAKAGVSKKLNAKAIASTTSVSKAQRTYTKKANISHLHHKETAFSRDVLSFSCLLWEPKVLSVLLASMKMTILSLLLC